MRKSAQSKWKASAKLPAPIALAILQRVDRLIPQHQDKARMDLSERARGSLERGSRHEDVLAEIAAWRPGGEACAARPAVES